MIRKADRMQKKVKPILGDIKDNMIIRNIHTIEREFSGIPDIKTAMH